LRPGGHGYGAQATGLARNGRCGGVAFVSRAAAPYMRAVATQAAAGPAGRPRSSRRMFLSLDNLRLRYEPFPIGIAKPVMSAESYQQFLDTYPPIELFEYIPKVGHKYCLSEKYNSDKYHDWIRTHPNWKDFHGWIKSDQFIYGVMDRLRERHIDLGFEPSSAAKQTRKQLKALIKGKWWKRPELLSARFEYSMLPAAGGSVTPHTDNPDKIVTMVVSMAKEGEWDPAYGGGTEVNRHKVPERSFNRFNGKAEFDEMETLDVYEFEPNQCVLFVKTFNSWHCVRPMQGNGTQAMRRTLTINIETRH
jgi:hypothetical protein